MWIFQHTLETCNKSRTGKEHVPFFLSPLSYGSICSTVWTLGQAVPGESLSLLEQVERENASCRLGLEGCKYNWETGPTLSQTALSDPAQPRFSKCVYFKAAGVLKVAYLDLFLVPETLAMDMSIHNGGGIWPLFICGTVGCKPQGLSAIWKEERNLSHSIRDNASIPCCSQACTGWGKGAGGTSWESSADTATLSCVKQRANRELLYSTGCPAWCSGTTQRGEGGSGGRF